MSLDETTVDKHPEVLKRIFYATSAQDLPLDDVGPCGRRRRRVSLKLCRPLRRCSTCRASCLFGMATF